MLVGRDLGLPNLVVLVVVFFILPAIGFVIRRKWRQAAARSEEIKRLLVFASEEATRAEVEATEGYFYTGNNTSSVPSPDSAWIPAPDATWIPAPETTWVPPTASVPVAPSLKPPYQCAVCFSPTSTRCAKCKAVRYCSGRCQIIHWRQGHKDECRPYMAAKPDKDASVNSPKRNENKDSNDTLPDENRPKIGSKSASESSEEYSTFSAPSRSSMETSSNSSRDSYVTSDNFETVKPKINVNKSNHIDEDIEPRFSSSSSRAVDEPSVCEPSTSASGFWSGTIHSKNSTIDDFEPSCSNETKNISGKSDPKALGIKKPYDEISSSKETLISGLKSPKPPEHTSEMLKHRELKDSKTVKDSKAFGGTAFSIPESSNHMLNSKNITKSTDRLASECTKPVTVHEKESNVATTSLSKVTEHSGTATNGLKTSMLKVVDQVKPSKLTHHCTQRAENETAHKFSCKSFFSYEMFVKLYNWKQVELRPFGLINCGNSCYANAVLQCLTYTPPLNAYLLQGLHSKSCDKIDWCFTCEFEGLVLKAKKGNNSPLSPIRILSQIQNIGSSLGHGREEDAHEFLRYAIDTLQSVCLKEAGIRNAANSFEEETTLIGLTFGGYLRSKIKCMKCGGKSERNERMMDLTVEIEGNIRTLEEALDKFTSTETLDGENKYKCSRCKSYEKAKKKLTLLEAPNVLTIALKRFQSGKFGKLNKSIHFPEILDMAPYVSGTSDKSPVYRLYGVVVHVDVMNAAFSGHYVCYVKNIENRWFKIDDSRVKEVDVRSVLTKGAYMLLYARCSPRAPRLIRSLLSRQHHDPKKHKLLPSFTSRSHSTQPWNVGNDHLPIRHRSLEEESSSSSDGSAIFSESCSCSTDSSHRDTASIEDHTSWMEWEHEYNSPSWRNSSDSDTSSSSSSYPSPLYSRHYPLYHDDGRCRKVSCSSSSYREVNVDRLGGRPNPFPFESAAKPTLRRSSTRTSSD